MKRITITLLMALFAAVAFSQTDQVLSKYQSSSNELYWKNRLPHKGYWQQDVHYKIDAVVNDEIQSIEGKEALTYWNNSPDTLYQVYFHLYQNAFTPNSYLHQSRTEDNIKSTFGEHEKNGLGTAIHGFKINGENADFTLDNTILIVQLKKPLLPNTGLSFDIHFTTYWDKDDKGNIRRRMKTFQHGGKDDNEFLHFDGVHWYPRICVYDQKFGWTTDQHLGKEFYGDYGVFEVSLDFPTQYVVEATGELMNASQAMPPALRRSLDISNFKTKTETYSNPIPADGSRRVWRYKAELVHDFAFTADPTYRIGEIEWNGIKCIALAQEEHAHQWQPTAQFVADVVAVYSKDIGMYAYPKMVAADARDGMEYPMITLNGGNWPGHQYVISHEVGHNWFFGMIGNNETYRASLDEGFTQFLTAWSLKSIRGEKAMPNSIDDGTVYMGYMVHAAGENNARLNIHSDHFNSAARHGGGYGQVYYKTATMLYNLQYILGDELFLEAMQHYFNQWKIAHPYWEDFRASIIDYTKVDLNWFFDAWIESTETIDYAIESVKESTDKGSYLITFEREGMQMPIDFTVIDKEGNKQQYHIPNNYFIKKTDATVLPKWTGWGIVNDEYTAVVTVPAGIRDVVIDESGRMADVYRLNNSKKMPKQFYLDKMRYRQSNFRTYEVLARPDLWYNAVDGLKIGGHMEGNYFGNKHKFNLDLWYNTGVDFHETPDSVGDNRDMISYSFAYSNKLENDLTFGLSSKMLDGFDRHTMSLGGMYFGDYYSVETVFAQRRNADYMWNKTFVNSGWDNRVNFDYKHRYYYMGGNGNIKFGVGSSLPGSNYNYSEVSLEVLNSTYVGKAIFKTRTYAVLMDGNNIAPESMVMLAGANNRDLMDNKYTRSRGWVPDEWSEYLRGGNHFHYGGGLNLRGYSGYLATNNNETDTFSLFAGTKGISLNAELGIGQWLTPKLGKLKKNLAVDPYVFGDAGILGNARNQYSDLRVDAGIGAAFSFSLPKYNKTKPLIIRFDVPLFLNRVAEEEGEYVAFRYLIGLNKAF